LIISEFIRCNQFKGFCPFIWMIYFHLRWKTHPTDAWPPAKKSPESTTNTPPSKTNDTSFLPHKYFTKRYRENADAFCLSGVVLSPQGVFFHLAKCVAHIVIFVFISTLLNVTGINGVHIPLSPTAWNHMTILKYVSYNMLYEGLGFGCSSSYLTKKGMKKKKCDCSAKKKILKKKIAWKNARKKFGRKNTAKKMDEKFFFPKMNEKMRKKFCAKNWEQNCAKNCAQKNLWETNSRKNAKKYVKIVGNIWVKKCTEKLRKNICVNNLCEKMCKKKKMGKNAKKWENVGKKFGKNSEKIRKNFWKIHKNIDPYHFAQWWHCIHAGTLKIPLFASLGTIRGVSDVLMYIAYVAALVYNLVLATPQFVTPIYGKYTVFF